MSRSDQYSDFTFLCYSDKGSGHGILEFSTDKAGQDVTPLNLEFDEPKQRSSTLNSITGERSPLSIENFPGFPGKRCLDLSRVCF
jgi:hypothetical protein